MGVKRIRERKKIAKERATYKANLRRKAAIRKKAKEDRKAGVISDMAYEDRHGKLQPIINDPLLKEIKEASKTSQVKARLQRNIEILEALEAEYDKEHAMRAEVNEKLEAEGHMTFREKMDSLAEKAQTILNQEVQVETDEV